MLSTGTFSATSTAFNTETVLYTSTSGGRRYQARVNLANLIANTSSTTTSTGPVYTSTGIDAVDIAAYAPVFSTATSTGAVTGDLIGFGAYTGPQAVPIKETIPYEGNGGFTLTLKQVAGNARAIDWAVYDLAST